MPQVNANFLIFLNRLCNAMHCKLNQNTNSGNTCMKDLKKIRKLENKHLLVAPKTRLKKIRK